MRVIIKILFLSLAFVQNLVAQEEDRPEVRQILVLPFSRFEFHTEIELQKINEINKITDDKFYPLLTDVFSEVFVTQPLDKVTYKLLREEDVTMLRSKFRYRTMGNTGHYACYPDSLEKSKYKSLLDKYECDYLLTINWYRVLTSRAVASSKGVKKVRIFSSHMIDYDLFSREMSRMIAKSSPKYEVIPDEENIDSMGLRILDLKTVLRSMVDDISLGIIELRKN